MKLARLSAVALSIAGLLFVAQLGAQSLPAAAPESVGMSAQRLGRISETFKREVGDRRCFQQREK